MQKLVFNISKFIPEELSSGISNGYLFPYVDYRIVICLVGTFIYKGMLHEKEGESLSVCMTIG